jgi:hypothetical protein
MFALTNFDAPSHDQEGATAANVQWRVCTIVLLLFILAATFSAIRKNVTQGFDELAHASYIAHLQRSGEMWPAFGEMRMLDPSSFQFTREANYLNHPSPYYFLLAHLGPRLEGHPEAILAHRLFNVAFGAIGLAALLALGLVAKLPRFAFYAYIVPLAAIPVLAPLAGAINNDNAAFAGGSIATLAAYQLLLIGRRSWLLAALGGVIAASWAKFTGLLLAGGLVGGVLLWLLWRGRLQLQSIILVAIAALLAGAPFIALFAQYGSPTPMTTGVIAMIKTGAQAVGWDDAARLTPVSFAANFVSEFVLEWMPTLRPRNALNYASLAIPIMAALAAFAGILAAIARIASGKANPLEIVICAGAIAFGATFTIHGIVSYHLHSEFGWLTSAYPRYYLPLAALVPLAGLSLLEAIKQPFARGTLLAFLTAGPLVFRLLGAPLG